MNEAEKKPPETYAGMSKDYPGSGRLFDRDAARRSVHRHFEVWGEEIGRGYTNNAAVFPKVQPK